MENRNGLVVDARLPKATGTAEPGTALDTLGKVPGTGRITVGAHKGYHTVNFVAEARALNVTHV